MKWRGVHNFGGDFKLRYTRHRGRVFFKVLFGIISICIFVGGLLAFTNLGGDWVLNIAKKTLREQAGLELNASGIAGNPIKGYTLNDLEILDLKNNKKLISSNALKIRLDLAALMAGTVRVIVHDSVVNTEYGTVNIANISAGLKGEKVKLDLDGKFNDVPVTGDADADIKKLNDNSGSKELIINKANIKPGSGNLNLIGNVNLENLNLNIHGAAQGINFNELIAMLPFLKLNKSDYDGTANLDFETSGSAKNPKVSGTVNYKGKKLAGYPAERINTDFVYANNRVTINNLQASVFNIPIAGEAAAVLKNNQPSNIMIKLDGGAANLDGFIPDLKGKVSDFNVNIQGAVDALNGSINFTAPNISYKNYKVSNIIANLKLANSDKANLSGKFNFEGAQGFLQGDVASILKNPKLNLTAKLVDLDSTRIAAMIPDASQYKLSGKITAALNIKGTTSKPNISGTISSPALSGMGQNLAKPQVDFSFENNTLSINKSAGTLNGMPINLTGKISALNSKNPEINIDAGVTVSPAALKAYVPDIDNYGVKGNINAGVKIRGKLTNPTINLAASSPNIQTADINLKNLEITTALNGDFNNINADIKAGSLAFGGLNFNNLNAKVIKTGDKINFTGLNAKSDAGNLAVNGTVNIAKNDPELNFKINGDALDLAKLTANIPDLKGQLSGRANLDFNLTGTAKNLNGNGNLKSQAVKAFNINLTDINLPLNYSGAKNSFASSNGTAKLYGGTAQNNFNFDLKSMKFNDNLNAADFEINDFIRDVSGGIGGKISGKGKLNLSLSGNTAKGVSYSGKGTFSMGTGAITGFKWLDLATKIYNSKGINYSDVTAPFTIQTGKLILTKNSAANALKNDRLYKYAKLTQDGVINFMNTKNITLNITAELSLNYQLVNALAGGGQGGLNAILSGGAKNVQESLLNAFRGGVKGALDKGSSSDFRTISVKISGKAASPSFEILKIGETTIKDKDKDKDNKENNADAKNVQQNNQNNKNNANNKTSAKDEAKSKVDNLSKKAADKIVDAILPSSRNKNNNKNQQNTKNANTANNNTNTNTKSREDELKDKLKEQLGEEIQKGLGGLFNRKKK